MPYLLVAESGGTKTDWCLLKDGVPVSWGNTLGMHPDVLNKCDRATLIGLLEQMGAPKDVPLLFFGAGCLRKDGAVKVYEYLSGLDLKTVYMRSDLHAAAYAALDSGSGWVAILGTGSVLFHFVDGCPVELRGGKGHKEGDEGSAYFFGKLVLQAFWNELLNNDQQDALATHVSAELRDNPSILRDKQVTASIAGSLATQRELFEPFHLQNMEAFVDAHGLKSGPYSISVVGSYAFYHQEILLRVLKKHGISVNNLIHRPIDALVSKPDLLYSLLTTEF